MNTWVLLERTHSVLPQLYREVGVPRLSLLFDTTELAAYSEQSPIFVACDESSRLHKAVRKAPEDWPALIIQSEHSAAQVLAHLRQILLVRFEGGRRGVLRYSNPTTASYFFPACQAEHETWLGPISRLSWYARTWADRAVHSSTWQSLENSRVESWKACVHEPVLRGDQERALRRQQQEHFLYRWWQKQRDVCFSQAQQWLDEGLHFGFTTTDTLEHYLNLRQVNPEPALPQQLPEGSDESRLACLLHHLQKTSPAQEY